MFKIPWLIASALNGELVPGKSSMLQSWGRSTLLHLESSRFTFSAQYPALCKSQSSSKSITRAFCENIADELRSKKLKL